jgi:phospholipid N-methyltransferase
LQISENLMFVRSFLRSPKKIGSAVPSSRFLISKLFRHFEWKNAEVVVEFGPGVGNITRQILQQLPQDAKLIAMETNRDMAAHLERSIDDSRLHTRLTSAKNVRKALSSLREKSADYIICGIPLSTMPRQERMAILRNSWKALKPGGVFLVYQFSGLAQDWLEEVFGPVRQQIELRNIPPAWIFRCEKRA